MRLYIGMPDDLALPRGPELAVCQVSLQDLPDSGCHLERLLSAAERDRAARYRQETIRTQFVTTRGLLRLLLGQLLDQAPDSVALTLAPDGKPVLADGDLHFNVSHTAGLALFAFSGQPVGVDVERVRPVDQVAGLVRRFFATEEQNQFQSLPTDLQLAGFFRGWTCKEAVLKGIGCGARDLNRCIVNLDPRESPGIVGPSETAAKWSVACWEPLVGYVASVARVRSPGS